ncbi:uncharacterized protein [Henckelia pumila]|uniref:uncharacterized protein n=1 Tax=Henckelia pumila TaxID=405737 RepID=UPI003C6DF2BF
MSGVGVYLEKHCLPIWFTPEARLGQWEAISGKTRLFGAGKIWVEEIPDVLWAYRNTPRTATWETPFSLVYGPEAVIPVKIGQISSRVKAYQEGETMDRTQDLDLIKEKRERPAIRMEAYRGRIMKAFNQKIKSRDFQIGELVLKKVNPAVEVRKLKAKWEGPYKIIRRVGKNAWYLEDNQGKVLQRPWNTMHLKSYYS